MALLGWVLTVAQPVGGWDRQGLMTEARSNVIRSGIDVAAYARKPEARRRAAG